MSLSKTSYKRLALAGIIFPTILIGLIVRSRHLPKENLSEPVKRGAISENVYGIGTVTANKSFQMRSGVTATVDRLFIKEGDQVKRGQKLIELNGGVPFTAPFDGTATLVPVKVGENIFPQTVIIELVDLRDRYIVVSLEQRAAVQVRRGQRAKLSFENLRETAYEGAVESVYSYQTSFLVRIEAPALPFEILPGMTADVAIEVGAPRDALLIPVAAIENGTVRAKTGHGRIRTVPIQTGAIDGALAEVVSGDLQEGDRLVIPQKAKL